MAEKNPKRTETFDIAVHIIGLGGHSSTPFKTHNPVIAGFELIHAVTQRLWYEFDAFDNVALYPVSFSAGTKSNIIPETAELVLRAEFVTESQARQLKSLIETSADAVSALYQVHYKARYSGKKTKEVA